MMIDDDGDGDGGGVLRAASFRHGRLFVLGGERNRSHAVPTGAAQRRRSVQWSGRVSPLARPRHVPVASRSAFGQRCHQHNGAARLESPKQRGHVAVARIRCRVLQSRDWTGAPRCSFSLLSLMSDFMRLSTVC